MVLCAAHVRMEKDFDRWNEIKKATDAADEAARLYFREGEIWWVRLGHNIGYEADGKSREFSRPVVILKKYNQYSFLAVPLTTVPKPNPYRYPVGIVDGKRAFATLSQLRNIDNKRLVKKIVHLDTDIFIAIKKDEPCEPRLASSLFTYSFAPLSQGEPCGHLYNKSYTSIVRMQGRWPARLKTNRLN